MAEVVFDHVTRIYPGNDKPSVDDLNLDIKDGEFLVLAHTSFHAIWHQKHERHPQVR